MSTEMLQARENLMEAIQAFLKKYDQIPPKEKSMALLLAEERFLKIKQAVKEEQNQPENIQELLLKLINYLQILNGIQLKQEEQAAKVSSQYWKPPIFYDDDDDNDEESFITLRDIISELPLSCVPKHAFCLWLAMLERLQTQDKVMQWGKQFGLLCPLCNTTNDSHRHLFFMCDYSKEVWKDMAKKMNLKKISYNWMDIVDDLIMMKNENNIWNVVRRISFAAVVYFIW
ncbi:hypothetical protein Tco_0718726 [Tanacetum coccineum]